MSSGSRGSSSGRYNDRSEYTEYGKSRRKNFYSPNTSRRDYKSSGAAKESQPNGQNRTYKAAQSIGTSSGTGTSGSGPNVRDSRLYINEQYSSSKALYGSYYPSYGSYNAFSQTSTKIDPSTNYYSSRSDGWRADRLKGGDSRLSSSNKPAYTRPTLSASVPSSSSSEFRKDRYDAYSEPSSSAGKWKGAVSYNANKVPVSGNRGSLSNSVRYKEYKDFKVRGGSSALLNSGKRNGDTYYPSRDSFSYRDRYSSRRFDRRNYSAETEDDRRERERGRGNENDENDENEKDENEKDENENDEYLRNSDVEKDEIKSYPYEENEEIHSHYKHEHEHSRYKHEHELGNEENDNENENENENEENENENEEVDNDIEDNEVDSEVQNEQSKPFLPQEGKVEEKFAKVDVSNEICYEDGCNYPLNYMETSLKQLENEFKSQHTKDGKVYMKYSLAQPITNLDEYSFFSSNFSIFIRIKDRIVDKMRRERDSINNKRVLLQKEYAKGFKKWEQERLLIDQQLRILHPPDDEMRREIDSSDNKKQKLAELLPEVPSGTNFNRRNRRHGDLVTTEAEFQEILQSLGKEDEQDPLVRAERVAATIPDLILDPVQRDNVKYMDSNNIVTDKAEWAKRVHTDFTNNFSAKEHELFCEGFCYYPKRFGAISRHMGGLRTAQDCVLYYYITKKAVNYKQMLAQHKKKLSKKAGRKKTSRSRAASQTQTPLVTPSDENGPQLELLEKEEEFTDTGRRKRAAAPTFKEKKRKVHEQTQSTNEHEQTQTEVHEQAQLMEVHEQTQSTEAHEQTKSTEAHEQTQSIEVDNKVNKADNKADNKVDNVDNKVNVESENKVKNPAVSVAAQDSPAVSVPPVEKLVETAETASKPIETKPDEKIHEDGDDFAIGDDPKERRKTISSYWSIIEANMFPELLQEHGSKWTTIADKLTTKTATMVRNYYQRNAEKNGWLAIAQAADARLEAKYAAVLKLEEPTTNTTNTISNITTNSNTNTNNTNTISTNTTIPIGTFQHPSKIGSISSLLTDSSNEIADPPKPPVQRSSIMSLLNSEASPVKPEPPQRLNNLHDILNTAEPNNHDKPHKPHAISGLLTQPDE